MDKQKIQDLLIDREEDMKRLTDPREFNHLKHMMKEMDESILSIDKEKKTQYDEMRKLT